MSRSTRTIDASLKQGERVDRLEQLRELLAIGSVRAGLAAAAVVAVIGLAIAGLSWNMDSSGVQSSMAVIARSVNSTRKLYSGYADFGSGSVLTTVLRADPYSDLPVKVLWLDGGRLDVRNEFGGRVDVVALRDHFEVHYGSVPASVCAKLALELAATKMPLFINTIHFAGPPVKQQSEKACYGEVNNIVLKFR